MLISNHQHAVAGHIKNTGDSHMKALQKTALAMAAAQLAPGSGACAQAALGSNKNENVVIK
jgi:hypothetical protein